MLTFASMDAYTGGRCILAMGKFDGVHRGHQAVLHRALALGKANQLPVTVLTFDNNPMAVIDPDAEMSILTPLEKKRALIEELGVDYLIVMPFTKALMAMEAEAFLQILTKSLEPAIIVSGENFTFGAQAKGDGELLKKLASKYDYRAQILPLYEVDGAPASSTRIRDMIARGETEAAARLLGRTILPNE